MAVSLLEQRLEALESRLPIGFPCGPCFLPPSMEALWEEYGDDGLAVAGRGLRRSHSWAGYASRLQLADRAAAEESELAPCRWESQRSTTACRGSGRCGGSSPPEAPSRRPSWARLAEEEAEEEQRRPQRHQPVRRRGTSQAEPAPEGRDAPLTTIMVQNLARNVTRPRFLAALDELGFQGRYDYVHAPSTFKMGRSQGFAFVNFVDEGTARDFAGRFQAGDGSKPADKLWRVARAAVQGSEANLSAAHSGKMTRVRSSKHRPMVIPQTQLPVR